MEYTSKEVYEYVSKKSNDPIVERKKCRLSGQEFPIYKSDLEFYDKVSPTFEMSENDAKEFFDKNRDVKDHFEYKDRKLKAKIPTPTLCPEERERRRFSFRNETNLYIRKSDNLGKNTISIYSPDKKYKVFDEKTWRTFDWGIIEGLNYKDGLDKNIKYLIKETPIAAKSILNNENSDFVNEIRDSKNCYMCFNCIGNEDCLYVYKGYNNDTSCVDCDDINECSFCYNSLELKKCLGVYHSEYCTDCSNSYYLSHCTNCHNCCNCENLENKSYCIDNKQYSKDEYVKLLSTIKKQLGRYSIVVGAKQYLCENSTGHMLNECKNCHFSSGLNNCENVKYTRDLTEMNNVYDGKGLNAGFSLETYFSGNSNHCGFIFECRNDNDVLYSLFSHNCSNCFGCVGLQNKEYYIYNKQYTKEEYNKLVPEIIAQMIRDKQWGEFFDPQLSYFGYNETIAMEFYPISKESALKMGYKRSDYEAPAPKVEKIVEGSKLPKQGCKIIQEKKPEFLKNLLNYAVVCEVSKRPFRITKQEIDFYIKHDLPLPTKHPDIRHQERLSRKDPTTLHLIHCGNCGEEMLSVHLPGEGKKILCEKCYNREV